MTIGLVHPGEMGAAVGAALRSGGHTVLWASDGRSAATAGRAKEAGLEDVGTVEELGRRSDVILSLCPPHAAVDVARSLPAFAGIYVDANAISPATARTLATLVGRYVDGGVIGSPPRERGDDAPLPVGRQRRRPSRRLFARHDRRRACDLRGSDGGIGAQDGLRRVDEGHGGPPARGSRRRARRRGRAGTAGRMEHVAAAAAGSIRRGGSLGARQGLAVGRRDGRDRRDVRCRGSAGRLSPRGRGDLPAVSARGRRRRRRLELVLSALRANAAPT